MYGNLGCEGDGVNGGMWGKHGFIHRLLGPPWLEAYRKNANKALNYGFTTSLTFRPGVATSERFR